MSVYLKFALGSAGTLICLAVLAPFISMWLKRRDEVNFKRVQRYAIHSGVFLTLTLCEWKRLSLPWHALNVGLVVMQLFLALSLVNFSFTLRPWPLAVLIGGTSALTWIVFLLFVILLALIHGLSLTTATMSDDLNCNDDLYGWVPSGGEQLNIYRRYFIIDHEIYSEIIPDSEFEKFQTPPEFQDLVSQCRAAIKKNNN